MIRYIFALFETKSIKNIIIKSSSKKVGDNSQKKSFSLTVIGYKFFLFNVIQIFFYFYCDRIEIFHFLDVIAMLS